MNLELQQQLNPFNDWFESRGWQLRDYQRSMLLAFSQRQSTLLIAPTGAGKTLSGLLPSLVDLHTSRWLACILFIFHR
jgi:ATP-dependent Lhr-like helicase